MTGRILNILNWNKLPLFDAAAEGGAGGNGNGDPATAPAGGAGGDTGANSGLPDGNGAGAGGDGAGQGGGNTLPDNYDFGLGEGVQLTPEDQAAYNELFKSWGLTQEQVTQLSQLEQNLGSRLQQEAADVLSTTMQSWEDAAKADPQIGGDKWDETLHYAGIVMDKYADEDIAELLDTTGMGSHPALLRVFSDLGRLMAPDTFKSGQTSGDTTEPMYRNWYKDTTPESKKG